MFTFASVHTVHGVVVTSMIHTCDGGVMDDVLVVGGHGVAEPMRPRGGAVRGKGVGTHHAWDRDRR